ncbi:MAG: endonuclease/exonuclease/phosphatase family protein [Pseudomonadota bacterium]
MSFSSGEFPKSLLAASLAILLSVPFGAAAQETKTCPKPEPYVCPSVFPGYSKQDWDCQSDEAYLERIRNEFECAATLQFNTPHQAISALASVPSLFRPNLNFPEPVETGPEHWPWYDEEVHPIHNAEAYLDRVLGYVMDACGSDVDDWDGLKCGWYHAPWMHDLREPMRGLTRERSSRLGELHSAQTTRTQNWAVGMYNEIGAHAFHQIWNTSGNAYPKTKNFAFADGTVAVKLLFSLATPEQVPYLRHAKIWEIYDGTKIAKARLMQIDVLVKDPRLSKEASQSEPAPNNDLTGWVMGSFLFNGAKETTPRCDRLSGDIEACEAARWRERLVPIGLQWGNNPGMYAADEGLTEEAYQHWMNPDIETMFANIRAMSGHPPHLGRDGRMNGPVDNYRSTCLACHARAVDFGRHEPDALRIVPFVARDDADNGELRRFFRNLDANEHFIDGTQSLDYSLQAAVGLSKFRDWVAQQKLAPGKRESKDIKSDTSNVRPAYHSPYALDGDITLATWNIANLHYETGVPLREGAQARTAKDFENLSTIASSLNADIVALQEIGSPTALKRLFPEEDFHLILSDRYSPGDEYRPLAERDIYTAFAIARDKFPYPPKVYTLDALSQTHFEYNDQNLLVSNRATRAGLVLEFEYLDRKNIPRRVSVLNVHLKSGCSKETFDYITEENGWRRYPCRTLNAQLDVMENWLEVQSRLKREIVILGDFNRRLNQLTGIDSTNGVDGDISDLVLDDFWVDLTDGGKHPPRFFKYGLDVADQPWDANGTPDNFAASKDTVCWEAENNRNDNQPVDFILIDQHMANRFNPPQPTKISMGHLIEDEVGQTYNGDEIYRLSDHCPVVVKLQRR